MSLFDWCRDTLTVERAPLVEERGSMIRDWEHAEPHTIDGCELQPGGMQLSADGTRVENRTVRWDVWLPPDADIEPSDRILIDGRPYAVEDGVQPWRGPTGMIDHLHMQLVDWKG